MQQQTRQQIFVSHYVYNIKIDVLDEITLIKKDYSAIITNN